MSKDFITINEACKRFNKSISTIRRIVKKAPQKALNKEKLITGHDKIYISLEYLKEYFNVSVKESSQIDINDSSKDALLNSLSEQLDFLKKQLQEKDKQIENFQSRQYENNVIIERLTQREQLLIETLENNKRKWWQRKK
jgi:hypothetical protein